MWSKNVFLYYLIVNEDKISSIVLTFLVKQHSHAKPLFSDIFYKMCSKVVQRVREVKALLKV